MPCARGARDTQIDPDIESLRKQAFFMENWDRYYWKPFSRCKSASDCGVIFAGEPIECYSQAHAFAVGNAQRSGRSRHLDRRR